MLDRAPSSPRGEAPARRQDPVKARRGRRLASPPVAGRYKIFLGMAAGVGKTYRMLEEAQAAAAAGRDVVIGFARDARAGGDRARARRASSGVPRRSVDYRGVTLEEIDLPGSSRARPSCASSTSSRTRTRPGIEHPKRYEDIADVLAAGIDVFSTVNVQHLESLNDQVAELTGVRVRETFPDDVLASRGRGRPRRPHAGGAAHPAARGQGLPAGAGARGAERLLPGREPAARCARSRCARWPRRSSRAGSCATRC